MSVFEEIMDIRNKTELLHNVDLECDARKMLKNVPTHIAN